MAKVILQQVAALPPETKSYAWASTFQGSEVLDEIVQTIGDDWLQQALFDTSQGDYFTDCYVTYDSPKLYPNETWYKVESLDYRGDSLEIRH